jgi:concentrative nucleoside transporter, CNT family
VPLFLQSALGISVFIGLAWAVSEDRRAFPWRIVFAGLALQFTLAAALLKLPWVRPWASGLNEVMHALERATEAGTAFVFGYLGSGALPFTEAIPGASFVIAFRALPLILVVSALSSLLFYWRVLPFIVRGLSRLFEKTLGIGGAVELSAAADVFVGAGFRTGWTWGRARRSPPVAPEPWCRDPRSGSRGCRSLRNHIAHRS